MQSHVFFSSMALVASVSLLSGCGGKESETPAAQKSAAVFTFNPPQNIAFTRNARWGQEIAIVGTPLRREETTTFTWKGSYMKDKDEGFLRDEKLVSLQFGRDGQVVAQTKAPLSNDITIRYHFDNEGKLKTIEGIGSAADALLGLMPPADRTPRVRELVKQAIEETAFATVDQPNRNVVGKPARVGEQWTIKEDVAHPEGGAKVVAEKTFVVSAMEACPFGTCARIDETVKMDPKVASKALQNSVNELLESSGAAPDVTLKEGTLKLGGSMVVDPKSMMQVNAKQAADGNLTFSGPKREVTVNVKNTRDVEYIYSSPPAPPK